MHIYVSYDQTNTIILHLYSTSSNTIIIWELFTCTVTVILVHRGLCLAGVVRNEE